MSDNFNPLKDIFNLDLNKLQDDTIKIISTIARESERNINAFVDCFQDNISSNTNINTSTKEKNQKTEKPDYKYECPFPERNKTFNADDICIFLDNDTINVENSQDDNIVDVDYTEITDNIDEDINNTEFLNPIDPFMPLDNNIENSQPIETKKDLNIQETIQEEDIQVDETPKKKLFNSIDPFEPIKEKLQDDSKDVKPLTDREVIDKTSSMWKYNPIDSTLELYPEYITETGNNFYADVVASRVRGKKHKHNSTNCDDYFKFSFVGNCCIVAVSDGAGSKVYSRVGAKEVTTSYVSAMSSAIENLLKDSTFLEGLSYPVTDALFNKSCSKVALELQNSVKTAYSSLVCKFNEISQDENYSKPLNRELNINDLSCTLLTAVIIPLETSNGVETFVATLQIGDGLICSVDVSKPFDSCTKILGVSDSGNFSGETEFITANDMMEQSNLMRRIKVMKGKTSAIILTTDGVADDYFPNETKCCNLYNDLLLNGVIPIDIKDDNSIKIVPPIREQKTIEENPKDICVAYCEDIQEFFNISDETLWNDKTFIENAVSVYSQCLSENKGENLQNWLDNYTKRGSFDDRTLFLYRPIK